MVLIPTLPTENKNMSRERPTQADGQRCLNFVGSNIDNFDSSCPPLMRIVQNSNIRPDVSTSAEVRQELAQDVLTMCTRCPAVVELTRQDSGLVDKLPCKSLVRNIEQMLGVEFYV